MSLSRGKKLQEDLDLVLKYKKKLCSIPDALHPILYTLHPKEPKSDTLHLGPDALCLAPRPLDTLHLEKRLVFHLKTHLRCTTYLNRGLFCLEKIK